MGVLLGAVSSLVLGTADFFGGRATQRSDGFLVVFVAGIAAVPLAFLAALLIDGSFAWGSLGLGLFAGVGSGVGLGSLYRGFAAASTGVVAPMAAVVSALVPVAYDLIGGTRLGAVAIAGIVLGLVALAFTTWAPDLGGKVAVGVGFGLLAGLGLGFGLAVLGQASPDAGVWPVVGQRSAILVVAGLIAKQTGAFVAPSGSVRSLALLSGALSTVGVACFVAGAQRGDLAPVAVAASQFPAVTVGLTALLAGERLRWWQVCGLLGAVLAISLIALG